jgi:transcriptional regulator with XRE-family HTH domain
MGNRYSSAAYRELGAMLRQIRKKAGLSSEKLARKLGWPLTTISRMEHGGRTSSTTDVIQYVVMCGMKAPEVGPILEFTRLAERKQGYYLSDWRIGGSLQSLIFHESSAEHSIIYEPHLIHGLLQTPSYAHARITALEPDIGEDVVASGVRTRMERRQVLYLPNPARFTFYMYEQALQLRVGTDGSMHEQLLHLVLTAALDNVCIRIVPRAAGEFGGGFHLMKFRDHRPLVYLDHLRFGGLILEDSDHVNSYCELVPMLADAALDEGQSREFVAALADEYDRGSQRGVSDVLAEEQLQQRRGHELRGGGLAQEQLQQRNRNKLRGGGVAEPPTPIYE